MLWLQVTAADVNSCLQHNCRRVLWHNRLLLCRARVPCFNLSQNEAGWLLLLPTHANMCCFRICLYCRARVQCFNLSQNEAVQYFNYAPHLHDPNQQRRQASLQHALQHAGRAAWMIQHPQQLVPPSRDLAALLQGVLRWEGYHPQEGFVGFGINLLRLSSEQLRFSVTVRGTPNNNNGEARGSRAASLFWGM